MDNQLDDIPHWMIDYQEQQTFRYFELIKFPNTGQPSIEDEIIMFSFNLILFEMSRKSKKGCATLSYFKLKPSKTEVNFKWHQLHHKLIKHEINDALNKDVANIIMEYITEPVHILISITEREFYE